MKIRVVGAEFFKKWISYFMKISLVGAEFFKK